MKFKKPLLIKIYWFKIKLCKSVRSIRRSLSNLFDILAEKSIKINKHLNFLVTSEKNMGLNENIAGAILNAELLYMIH